MRTYSLEQGSLLLCQLLDPLALALTPAGIWLTNYAAELRPLLGILALEPLKVSFEVRIEE